MNAFVFRSINIFVIMLAIGLISESYGQTSLPEFINSDLTLTKSNSPYRANNDVTVNSGVTLTVDPGVTIEFASNSGLYVRGKLIMNGESDDWIFLKPVPGYSTWEVVTIENTSSTSVLKYVDITGCTRGNVPNRDRGAVNASNVNEIILENVRIYDVLVCIYFHYSDGLCTFKDCYFQCNELDHEYLMFLVLTEALIQGCEFAGVNGKNSDAIDFDKVKADIIGNTIYGMNQPDCDAIDMGSESEVYLKDNIIMDCTDSGIEAEEGSIIVAENNLIINCAIGATIKENAVGTFTNNTFYNNDIAFEAYSETNVNGRGGTINARNNIIYEYTDLYSSQHGSSISFSYNLTEEGTLSGSGNIYGNPLFKDIGNNDFHLELNSPAIDAGDPASPLDPDGTRADMGAFYYEQVNDGIDIVISEIHYFPLIDGIEDSNYEFIELYNNSDQQLSIGNYSFDGAVEYTFAIGTVIFPGEYLLICYSIAKYSDLDAQVFEWFDGGLSNNGDIIYLRNDSRTVISEVTYSIQEPWPLRQQVSNVSIELISPDSPIAQPSSWRHSFVDGGTPGGTNDRPLLTGLFINELVSKYGTSMEDEFGNYSDWIEIFNDNSFPVYINNLYISDDLSDPLAFNIPEGEPDNSRVSAKDFIVLFADASPELGIRHLNFQLASSGEAVGLGQLFEDDYYQIDQVEFGPLLLDQSYGRVPDGSDSFQYFDKPTPGEPNEVVSTEEYFDLKINELVAKYDNSYPDEHGLYSDWIEFYNSGEEAVNMSGLYLSDNANDLRKHRISANFGDSALVQPGGFMVFRSDDKTRLGFNHLGFELSSGGEEVLLSIEINGQLEIIDQKGYPSQVQGKSYGRLGDGGKWWAFFGNPTPGTSNSTTSVENLKSDKLDLLVYPNPTTDILTILLTGEILDIELVEVFDMQGGKWKTWHKEDLKIPLKLELYTKSDAIPSGVYVIRLTGPDKALNKRFIIQ